MYDYLEGLNPAQKEAVINTKGPALVIAGAGSGKTRVLTYRIAHLLRNGVAPFNILSLTFTNKAAREMKDRIAVQVGERTARNLWMGTFHSIFARILRAESEALGYPSNFTIYDTIDSKSLIRKTIKDLKLDDKIYKQGEVLSRISSAKNNLITWENYINNPQIHERDLNSHKPEIGKIYRTYAARCKKAGAMDFDDLLLNTNILFRDHPEVLAKYQDKFGYVLVDEYQDTNYSQYLIVKRLSEKHNNLCVVGDDAQSIYSFRGAQIENILNFRNDYKNYKLYKLEQNYRSTQTIVEAANGIIAKNENQLQKKVFSENDKGSLIQVLAAYTDNEEGAMVANSILDTHSTSQATFDSFAILYRTNAQSRILEESLRKRNIPYKIFGGLSFYQRKEIKDFIAYLRLPINPADDEAFKRIINYPKRGIGNTTLAKIEDLANQHGISMWETLNRINSLPLNIAPSTLNKIKAFRGLIVGFMRRFETDNAFELARDIASKSGILQDLYKDKTIESLSKHENVQELLNGIKEFADQKDLEPSELTLSKYLEDIALLTNDDKGKEEDTNRVVMMTIHSAKGLEFKNVFITGLEEELFPSKMSSETQKDLEEERRLFYVAVTRAEKELTLSYARTRQRWGTFVDAVPSRFIKEIEPEFLNLDSLPAGGVGSGMGRKLSFGKQKSESDNYESSSNETTSSSFKPKTIRKGFRQNQTNVPKPINRQTSAPSNFEASDWKKLKQGQRVEHQRFGFGVVMVIEGTFPNVKASIKFEVAGLKQLLLKFAKLKIVSEAN